MESWMLSIVGAVWGASWYLFNRKSVLDDRVEERAKKVYTKWEDENPRYSLLISDLQKLDERLKEINVELKNRFE